jgi:hypothetical protein
VHGWLPPVVLLMGPQARKLLATFLGLGPFQIRRRRLSTYLPAMSLKTDRYPDCCRAQLCQGHAPLSRDK